MKLLRWITIWAIYSTSCIAGEKSGVIGVAFPEAEIISSSTGSIYGKSYLSAVLRMSNENSIALVLFQSDKNSNFKLTAKSAWWLEHQRWNSKSTIIKNNSVYFLLDGSGGCCSDYYIPHQFTGCRPPRFDPPDLVRSGKRDLRPMGQAVRANRQS